jgi:hypothetical protein
VVSLSVINNNVVITNKFILKEQFELDHNGIGFVSRDGTSHPNPRVNKGAPPYHPPTHHNPLTQQFFSVYGDGEGEMVKKKRKRKKRKKRLLVCIGSFGAQVFLGFLVVTTLQLRTYLLSDSWLPEQY